MHRFPHCVPEDSIRCCQRAELCVASLGEIRPHQKRHLIEHQLNMYLQLTVTVRWRIIKNAGATLGLLAG